MMKVYLNKAFKNHPAGTELDVSPRVYQLLVDRGVVKVEKKRSRRKEKEEKEIKEENSA